MRKYNFIDYISEFFTIVLVRHQNILRIFLLLFYKPNNTKQLTCMDKWLSKTCNTVLLWLWTYPWTSWFPKLALSPWLRLSWAWLNSYILVFLDKTQYWCCSIEEVFSFYFTRVTCEEVFSTLEKKNSFWMGYMTSFDK